MTCAHHELLATFAGYTSEVAASLQANLGGAAGAASDPSAAAPADSLAGAQPTTPAARLGGGQNAMIGLNATMSGFVDKRITQMELLVMGLTEDKGHLQAQLDDLRAVHDQLHSELTRSYKEYDLVQRHVMDLLAEKRAAAESHHASAAAQQQEN